MILTLKNKMLMAMDQVIADADKFGGAPKSMLLEPKEAIEFLKEIRDNPSYERHVDVTKYTVPIIHFAVFRRTIKYTVTEINEVVREWYAKTYTFKYKNVDLIIVKPVKQKVPEIKPFNCWGDISDNQDYD